MKHETGLLAVTTATAFAAAWRAAIVAASNDDERPVLYRTVLVETYEGGGARFTSLDTFVISSVAITGDSASDPFPTLDEAPVASVLVADPDHRGKGLAAYAAKVASRANKADQPEPRVTFTVRDAEDHDHPVLSDDFATQEVVIDLEDSESVALPLLEIPFPTYRSILAQGQAPVDGWRVTAAVLDKVAAIAGYCGGIASHEPAGRLMRFHCDGWGFDAEPVVHCDGAYTTFGVGDENEVSR